MELVSNSLTLSQTHSRIASVLQIRCREQLLAVERLYFALIISEYCAVNHPHECRCLLSVTIEEDRKGRK